MKLATYCREDGSETVGVWRDQLNGPYDLIRALTIFAIATDDFAPMVADMLDLLDAGIVDVELLSDIDASVDETGLIELLSDAGDYKLVAPIARPRAIYALGRNYPAHARESGAEVPEEPIIFAKAPTAYPDGIAPSLRLRRRGVRAPCLALPGPGPACGLHG